MSDLNKNLFHRSISHSVLFFLILSPVTGWGLYKLHSNSKASSYKWTQLAFWSYLTHALLDSFTTWGTQLFWPIGYKVTFKSIFVIDPLYTIPLIVFLTLSLRKERKDPKRAILNWSGIIISSLYLVLTLVNKQVISSDFNRQVQNQNIAMLRIESKPSPLNNILWTTTVEDSLGFYIGYKSFLDRDEKIPFEYFPKNHHLITPYRDEKEIQKIINLTEDWYTVETTSYGLKMNDLRFGTNTAWVSGGDFVFSYDITVKNNKVQSIQQGEKSFRESPGTILFNLAKRIWGN